MSQLEFVVENIPNFLIGFPGHRPGGLLMSVLLCSVAFAIGMVLAVGAAGARGSSSRTLRAIAAAFIHVMRGVPLILLLLLVHQLLRGWSPLGFGSTVVSATVTLALYSAAYQADIVAAGFRAVPRGLIEDSRLLGCGPWRMLLSVRIPYSVRTM